MNNIFSKDDDLSRSAPVIGFEILKLINKSVDGRLSIFDIANEMKRTGGINARSIYYAMLFLYSMDIIDFDEPYLIANAKN